ncbi:MAG: PilZ domain-containing protein [Armatimonadetes bacterium]|nr:PilZ domain-containing protein [Armatimonadota bacterium]
MLDFLRRLTPKKKPVVEVVDYAKGLVYFRCLNVALEKGLTEATAHLPDGEVVEAELEVLDCDNADYIYSGRVRQPLTLGMKLAKHFPPALDEVKPWYEKREITRLDKVLMVMSPQLPGFKAVTYDITIAGVRLDCDGKLEPDTQIQLRMDFDDHRMQPLQMTGRTVWCRIKPASNKFWVGVKLDPIADGERERLATYLEHVKTMERGVVSREYRFD